jgi:hypothetical protein
MSISSFKSSAAALLLATIATASSPGRADVVVDIPDANTAIATISLTAAHDQTVEATVTVAFDQAVNLSADSLNLTAELLDPANLPALPAGVSIDPAFPVLVSVEPPVALFRNGYQANQSGDGNLAFYDTYQLEVHTHDLACSSTSQYRLYKAPHGSTAFADVTDDILAGSVRARGRGGAFSQFLVVKDTNLALTTALLKLTNLTTRLNLSNITNLTLVTSLLNTLLTVTSDVVTLQIGAAIASLDNDFIAPVTAAAGIDIANEWIAGGSLNNDAGDLISLAQTLRFTLTLLQGDALCLPPGP